MEVFTDGSASPNPGPAGWAFAAIEDGTVIEEQSGGEPRATNNAMEFAAIVRALRWLPPGVPAVIVSDSKLAVEVLSGNWRPKANLDLIKEARALMQGRQVKFRWIRSHSGDYWNEYVDGLAKAAVGLPTKECPQPWGCQKPHTAGRAPLPPGNDAAPAPAG